MKVELGKYKGVTNIFFKSAVILYSAAILMFFSYILIWNIQSYLIRILIILVTLPIVLGISFALVNKTNIFLNKIKGGFLVKAIVSTVLIIMLPMYFFFPHSLSGGQMLNKGQEFAMLYMDISYPGEITNEQYNHIIKDYYNNGKPIYRHFYPNNNEVRNVLNDTNFDYELRKQYNYEIIHIKDETVSRNVKGFEYKLWFSYLLDTKDSEEVLYVDGSFSIQVKRSLKGFYVDKLFDFSGFMSLEEAKELGIYN